MGTGAAALLLAATTAARAQGVPSTSRPYPGTVQAGLFDVAQADNRRVFGVSSYLDGTILPRMDLQRGPFVVADTSSILGVTRAASAGCWTIPPDRWVGDGCTMPMDLGASQVGAGYSWTYGGVFYGATFTTGYVAESNIDRALFAEAIIPGMAIVAPYTAPLLVGPTGVLGQVDDGFLAPGMEYVVGGRLTLPIGEDSFSAHAGFMASAYTQGVFTSLTEEQLRALVTIVLEEEAVPYLLSGINRSPLLFRAVDEIGEWPMLTSLFARKVDLPRPIEPSETTADTTTEETDEDKIPFWTGHVEQYNIGPIDVRAAVSWRPRVQLHALLLTWHTPNFNPVYEEDEYGDGDYDDIENYGLGVTAGMVTVPPAYYLAAPGGPSLHLDITFKTPRGGGISVAMNHPDTLVSFPYAQNSLHISGKVRL